LRDIQAQHLDASSVPTVLLHAAYFMANWMPRVGETLRNDPLPTFLAPPERAMPMVATVAVGRAATTSLQAPPTANCAVTLAGPRDYGPNDAAVLL
jgi:uncharacterized protein YbjT (DUF2867 family)